MSENSARLRQLREQEEAARQAAAEEERQRAEEIRRRHRRQRREEEAASKQWEREFREFQRNHGVAIPETPRPSVIRLRIKTPISTLSIGLP